MTLKLKIGKRYVRRDGKVTAPLIANIESTAQQFPFRDPVTRATYTTYGTRWLDDIADADLLREYKPAKPEWRIVVKCKTRKQARDLVACVNQYDDEYGRWEIQNITVEKSS